MTNTYGGNTASAAGTATYTNLAAFPAASSQPDGTLAVALDTDGLYVSNQGGNTWTYVGATLPGNLTGDVTSAGLATTVALVGGSTAAAVHQSVLDTVAATNADTNSTIVKRDSSGNFAATTITSALTGTASGNVTTLSVASANGLAGSSSGGQTPALTLSTSVTGVVKGNGTALSAATSGTDYAPGTSALITGILKSTTTTGALSIATAPDFPTLNQNTTGTAASFTGNLTGDVTSTGMATTLAATTNATLATLSGLTSAASLATVGTIGTGTWAGTTVAVNHGGTGVTSVTTAPAATAFAGWDANSNLSANNHLSGYATTVTAAATSTLVVGSPRQQFFTGTTTQTVVLPDVTTLSLGLTYQIVNNSTGVVTVNSSGANLVKSMAGSSAITVTVIAITGSTAASWYVNSGGAGGVTSVDMSVPSLLSISGNPITGSGTLALTYSGTALPVINGGTGQTSLASLAANVATTGTLSTTNTTQSTSNTTGALLASGGLGVVKNIVSGGQISPTNFAAGNSSTALTIDFNNGNDQSVTMTGNCTFTFSNPIAGAVYTLILLQDGTGSRLATWPGTVTWSNAQPPVLNTAIGNTDVISFVYDGTTYWGQAAPGTGQTNAAAIRAGYIGEIITQSRLRSAATSLTTATSANVLATALTLTPGVWDIYAQGGITYGSATVTQQQIGVSVTSATLPGTDTTAVPDANGQVMAQNDPVLTTTSADVTLSMNSRVNININTTYYLVANVTFSAGTATAYGSLIGKRVA